MYTFYDESRSIKRDSTRCRNNFDPRRLKECNKIIYKFMYKEV